MEIKQKPKAKIEHLVNWYYGNFCVWHKHCTKEHYEDLKKIVLSWGISEMKHKEFCDKIRKELKCYPIKREFHDCPICRKLGVSQWRK
jgi:hypothetical protein